MTPWEPKPTRHKGSWRGKPRVIYLGPEAQAVLAPWLLKVPAPDAFVFSPARAVAEKSAERSANRKTKRWPSHMKRNATKRKGTKRKRPPADVYHHSAFSNADRLVAPAARADGADDVPATHVSALDAAALCRWLNRLDAGRVYRLPTEAEWEFLARAGREAAVHPLKAPLGPAAGPSALDTRRANPFGLLDVLGNVSECTATPFAFQSDAAALNRSAPDGGSGALAIRGGSWRCRPEELTLAWRKSVTANRRADDIGARLVCEPVKGGGAGGEEFRVVLSDVLLRCRGRRDPVPEPGVRGRVHPVPQRRVLGPLGRGRQVLCRLRTGC